MAISKAARCRRLRRSPSMSCNSLLAIFAGLICLLLILLSASPPPRRVKEIQEDTELSRLIINITATSVEKVSVLSSDSAMEVEAARVAARKGVIQWGSLGPRPPMNEKEHELAQIPEYEPAQDLAFYSHIHKTSGTSLSNLLSAMFPESAIVPTSHPYKEVEMEALSGHNASWWQPYQVIFSHNRPLLPLDLALPGTKRPRLLLMVRNPLLHKASIYYEFICKFGHHIKDGVVDREAAVETQLNANPGIALFCRDPELWVGSPQFLAIYRNFQSNWLAYGGAESHPCIEPQMEFNLWKSRGSGVKTCDYLREKGLDSGIWEEYFERAADSAIRKLEGALWVGVTERLPESTCLLFLTLGKPYRPIGEYRVKTPRPISMWNETSIDKAAKFDRADWRVFDAANEILDLRIWAARERLKHASVEERMRLGPCVEVISGNHSAGHPL